ncbi:unnamed protein product [Anisakis simplex]|uniref:MFS domain-containing protein n=1 Tax=Anisakis simplex TaxID=6269 RepID=A0A0M3K1B9_ANISI|nr:unnamed protein product [Anisakis simplex]
MVSEKESSAKASIRLENEPAEETSKLQPEITPASAPPKPKTVDDFLKLGLYTLYAGITAEFVLFNMLSNMIYMVYSGAAPVVVSCGNYYANTTDGDICQQYNQWRSSGCKPVLDYQFLSFNVEYDYICGEAKYVKNSISVQMLGILIGTLVFGQMSDSFGRRTVANNLLSYISMSRHYLAQLSSVSNFQVLLITSIAAIILGAVGSFAGSLVSFTIWRCITSFFAGGEIIVLMVYLMEQVPKAHRLWISTVVTWSPNFIILAGVAYISYDWRTLARAISIISLPVVPLLYFSHESPRWLFQKGKVDSLRKALVRIRGGKKDEKEDAEMERMFQQAVVNADMHENRQQHYIYHLFYTWELTLYTIVLSFGMFVTSITNYGLLFNMEKLSGSIYLNSAFFGLFRWSMNIVAGALDYFCKSIGRKSIHFFAMAFIAAAVAIAFAVYTLKLNDWMFLVRYCALAAAAMCSQLYLTKTVVMVELYPTAVRNIATSFMGLLSRVGNILAPQLFYLADIWIPLPYLTMMLLALIDLFDFQIFIPETKGKPLKDHLPPPEECIWRRKKLSAEKQESSNAKENAV